MFLLDKNSKLRELFSLSLVNETNSDRRMKESKGLASNAMIVTSVFGSL